MLAVRGHFVYDLLMITPSDATVRVRLKLLDCRWHLYEHALQMGLPAQVSSYRPSCTLRAKFALH